MGKDDSTVLKSEEKTHKLYFFEGGGNKGWSCHGAACRGEGSHAISTATSLTAPNHFHTSFPSSPCSLRLPRNHALPPWNTSLLFFFFFFLFLLFLLFLLLFLLIFLFFLTLPMLLSSHAVDAIRGGIVASDHSGEGTWFFAAPPDIVSMIRCASSISYRISHPGIESLPLTYPCGGCALVRVLALAPISHQDDMCLIHSWMDYPIRRDFRMLLPSDPCRFRDHLHPFVDGFVHFWVLKTRKPCRVRLGRKTPAAGRLRAGHNLIPVWFCHRI